MSVRQSATGIHPNSTINLPNKWICQIPDYTTHLDYLLVTKQDMSIDPSSDVCHLISLVNSIQHSCTCYFVKLH